MRVQHTKGNAISRPQSDSAVVINWIVVSRKNRASGDPALLVERFNVADNDPDRTFID